jgi:hypothetical protein
MILSAVVGFLIVAGVLWEAFETIVLPRRVTRRWRLTRTYYRGTWFPWRKIASVLPSGKQREGFLSIFGPLSLLMLFVLWAATLILGFGLLFYGASRGDSTHPSLQTCIYLSGTTLFTLGLGDVTPHTTAERILAVTESGLGFGFLALVLSYLPVIYQAFSRRETYIVLLDARAGSPPTAGELLRRHAGTIGMDALQELLHEWERAAAEILESHISYPAVSYFRSQHNNESWLGALAAILDASALLVSGADGSCARQARLTFAMCRHAVADLAQVFSASPHGTTSHRLSPDDLHRLRESLAKVGLNLRDTPEADHKLAELRHMYEPYLQALANYLYMELSPWILSQAVTDNWRTSAWGRITGFSVPSQDEKTRDDHN